MAREIPVGSAGAGASGSAAADGHTPGRHTESLPLPVFTDPARFPSPCFVLDSAALERNLQILSQVQQDSGAVILMALKAFAMHAAFPQIRRHLGGVCASGPHEARLGREEFGGMVHTFAAAYSGHDLEQVLELSDHIVFNSCGQWQRFRERCLAAAAERRDTGRPLSFGLRLNPEHSEGTVPLYDPCAPYSRLGITETRLREYLSGDPRGLEGITGLHMHTLCEQGADALERTLEVFEQRFADILPQMEWINLGGGHHITQPDYDRGLLVRLVTGLRERWGVQVYLEPGEAVVINTGVLVCSVLDVTRNGMDIAILDISATAHMPDVLEMPYRPEIRGAWDPRLRFPQPISEQHLQPHPQYAQPQPEGLEAARQPAHVYRLGGMSCLSGDVIGDYAFSRPLQPGDRIVFEDMSHYTMVKTTMFNGVHHPAIALYNPEDDSVHVVRRFGYPDFRDRLS
ncbi:MAG: carboxynorspermidine decarboxylase [Spirochaeta sp.]